MDLSISNLIKNIKGYLAKLSKGKRIALAALLVSVLGGAVILANVLDSAGYTVLYRGLSPSEGVEIVNLMDDMGTDYRMSEDGTILVPKTNVAMLKMQLAAEGFPKSTLGYDLFTNQSNLMTTDYEKRQYLIFQLQDRLQESLKTLEGVKNAIVTLNVPDDNSFVLKSDKPQASASVVLELTSYTDLTKKQIRGIEALVAKSVPGLLTDNVAIVDSTGEVLNEKVEELSGEALSQIDIIKQVNDYYKEKITNFLKPVFGEDSLSVAVSVQVDFQHKTSEQTTYTPVIGDNGILSRQNYDIQSINGGTVQSIAGTFSNTGVPTYANNTNTDEDQSASESGSNEYLVNTLIQGIEDRGGTITDMTVAIMINSSYLSDDLISTYKEMVAYSAGIPVEKVVITHAEFTPKPEIPTFTDDQALDMNQIVFAVAGVLVLLLAAAVFFILRMNRKRKRAQQRQQQQRGQAQHRQPGMAAGQAAGQPGQSGQHMRQVPQQGEIAGEVPGEIVLTETREQGMKRQVKEFATANPEIVAQLIRTWMKDDDSK